MTYIFLVAGKGTRLHPLTLNYPKTLYKLNENETVIQRMVKLIKKHDPKAEIVVVTGFQHEIIEKSVDGVIFINNPFYAVTNSIASLWFAREYLNRDNVTVINGDIVMSEELVRDVLCKKTDKTLVLYDSSIKKNGDYNVSVSDDHVIVMSKELDEYEGEYAGVTKFDAKTARDFIKVISEMVDTNQFDQWYENALVQMIFRDSFKLGYLDICDYQWTEIDAVNDLLLAKRISKETK